MNFAHLKNHKRNAKYLAIVVAILVVGLIAHFR